MSVLLGILIAIVVFMIIVGIHEWWHFRTAKMFGVHVYEFGLGIPPRLKRLFTDQSGTEYTLNWLPLGGFVRLKGDTYAEQIKDDKDALFNKAIWKQMIVMLAGIFMNFFWAAVLLAMVFMIGTKPIVVQIQDENASGILSKFSFESLLIPQYDSIEAAQADGMVRRDVGVLLVPIEDSPAYEAGIRAGDILLGVDLSRTHEPEDLSNILATYSPGQEVTLHVIRWNELIEFPMVPKDRKVWVYARPNYHISTIQYGILESLKNGAIEAKNQIVLSFKVLGYMISTWTTSDDSQAREEVTKGIWGPVAVGNVFVSMAKNGIVITNLLIFAALISISLGVFNLLPFPALDGGRFFVLLVNGISRSVFKKDLVSAHMESYIHTAGFLLLMLVALLVAYKDILNIFAG